MPYTKKQRALFNAAANDPKIAKANGMSQHEAKKLAEEANSTPLRKAIKKEKK